MVLHYQNQKVTMKQCYYLLYRPYLYFANCLINVLHREKNHFLSGLGPIWHFTQCIQLSCPSIPSDLEQSPRLSWPWPWHFLNTQAIYFQTVPQFEFVWYFFMVRFRICTFSRNTTKEMLQPSYIGIWDCFFNLVHWLHKYSSTHYARYWDGTRTKAGLSHTLRKHTQPRVPFYICFHF